MSECLPIIAAIALGSNLGDRQTNIHAAVDALKGAGHISNLRVSSMHRTQAVAVAEDIDPGPEYLNAAAVLETTLEPLDLLDLLQSIERSLGRDRTSQPHGSARVIDLDLILYADVVISTPRLTLPHPGLPHRLFVLVPLAEIAADMQVAGSAQSVAQLLTIARAQAGGSL